MAVFLLVSYACCSQDFTIELYPIQPEYHMLILTFVYICLFIPRQNDATIPATVIQNLPEEADNMSLSFDIRVTAEDSVTTNLYKFVLGSPSSIVKVFAAGSTYDVTSSQAVPAEAGDDDSGVWPLDPFQKSHCTKCPRGMYSSAIDSPQCSPCPPGHFTDSLGSCDCQQCSPGTFTYTWTSEACRYAALPQL